ncbi:MAG: ATP-binding protein [Anaplasma sp.]
MLPSVARLVWCSAESLGAWGRRFGFTSEVFAFPWRVGPGGLSWLLLGGLLLSSFLITVLSYWAVRAWMQYRKGELGFRFQARVVLVSTVVAIVPTALVSGFSSLFFDFGMRSWFRDSVGPAFSSCSGAGVNCNMERLSAVLSADASRFFRYLGGDVDSTAAREKMEEGIVLFDFAEVLLINGGEVLASTTHVVPAKADQVPVGKLKSMRAGETLIHGCLMYALVPVESPSVTHVAVARILPQGHNKDTPDVSDYKKDLKLQLSILQIQFSLALLFLFLVVLFVVIWLGVGFSRSIAGPLLHLLRATKQVQGGDFSFKIEAKGEKMGEEMATVVNAFNAMVEQLGLQRLQLESAYKEINSRRELIETVLSGVSSGVMALSASGEYVTLMNDRAQELLCFTGSCGPMDAIFPEVRDFTDKPEDKQDITIARGQKSLLLSVHIKRLNVQGLIITFDDISGLVEAQRKAAWSDVAQRIAHEIKNPITPIYLAAERLGSKYAEQIVSDREMFLKYTDTIVKHVSNISGIVDEFAKFARMPSPVFDVHDICALIREVSFLSGQFGKKSVHYELDLPDEEVSVLLDREQISQVFINIFKNSCESIDAKEEVDNGHIMITLAKDQGGITVELRDNGVGFPEDLIARLTEPYVTTREHGTGLGLAIVKKILDEHGAYISFQNPKEGGGTVLITFLLSEQNSVGLLD